jgi:hypothetical protein
VREERHDRKHEKSEYGRSNERLTSAAPLNPDRRIGAIQLVVRGL